MNTKNKLNLLTLIISILLIFLLLTPIIIGSISKIKFTTSIDQKNLYNILKFNHNGGLIFQTGISSLTYLGISLFAIWDNDIRNDMNTISWNMYNENEEAVLDSQKVSFYKGVPIFRFNYNRSGSFLAIFLTKGIRSTTAIRHEWGHNIQQLILGPINYWLCIFLPSWQEWSNKPYYDRPWEITADIFGGVTSRKHNIKDIEKGFSYLNISAMFSILAYSFLLNEY